MKKVGHFSVREMRLGEERLGWKQGGSDPQLQAWTVRRKGHKSQKNTSEFNGPSSMTNKK